MDGDGVGVRLGYFFILYQSAFANNVLLECAGGFLAPGSDTTRHDTTETANQQRKETKKKKKKKWRFGREESEYM